MQRVRGLAPVVAVALLGGVLLAGCRSNPTAAAYVGDVKITEKQVSDIVDNWKQRTTPTASPEGETPAAAQPLPRSSVVTALVVNQVCAKLKDERHFTTTPVTPAQLVQGSTVPADAEYVKLLADMATCVSGLKVAGDKPTEDQLRDLYNNAAANGLVDTQSQPFDAVKDSLAADESVQQITAAHRALVEGSQLTKVTVNPRYRPLEYPVVLQDGVFLNVPIGEAGLDAVTPAPTQDANASDGAVAPPQ